MTDDLTRIAGELEVPPRPDNAADDLAWLRKMGEWNHNLLRHAPALIAALRECAAWRARQDFERANVDGPRDGANREYMSLNDALDKARSATDAAVREVGR